VENLVDGVRPADTAALTEVLEQVERLGGLVEDLLGLARAEAGAVPVQREPTRLAPLVDDVVEEARTLRPDRHLVTQIDDHLIADVDPRRLRQILANLVDNATRHTPSGGQVVVSAQLDPRGVLVLDVADTGPGIPPEARAAVFERFRHGPITGPLPRVAAAGHPDRPGTAAVHAAAPGTDIGCAERGILASGGTGLGLAIARWAATLHGGSIEVLPAAQGARIRVTLPPGRAGSA
jgi:signal transduction histidine kinase